MAAATAQVHPVFWPILLLSAVLMQRSCRPLQSEATDIRTFGLHFRDQVRFGSLVLLGLILSRSLMA